MKRIILFLYVFAVCGITAYSQTATANKTGLQPLVFVIADRANIREAPSTQAALRGTVRKGQIMTAFANQGNWYYVTAGKIRGWIHYTTIQKAETKKQSQVVVKKDYSNIYQDEWLRISRSSDGITYFYNPARMTKHGSIVSVWMKGVYDDDKTESMVLYQINCQSARNRQSAGVGYYPTGVIKYNIDDSGTKWSTVIPGSIGEILMHEVCKAAN